MFSHCDNFRRVLFTNYSQRLSTVFNKNIFRYRLFTNNFDYIFNRNRFGSAYRAFFSSLQLLEFRTWNTLDSQRLSTVFNKNIFRYRLFTNSFDYILHCNRFGSAYRAFFLLYNYSNFVPGIRPSTILFFFFSLVLFVTNITHLQLISCYISTLLHTFGLVTHLYS